MNFLTYARLHGVLIDRLQDDGKWHRVPTESHPKKKNGAYRFMGTHGHVQDHASMTEPALWTPDEAEAAKIDHAALARRAQAAADEIRQGQLKAARKAAMLLDLCAKATHPYLASKGFPDELGYVLDDTAAGDKKLCIPMKADNRLVGMQTISDRPGFEKKFLYGQRTSEAVYVINNAGPRPDAPKVFCEGWATGLSVRRALRQMPNQRYILIVCFTAGNLLKVATNHGTGVVIADHDRPHEQAPEPGGTGVKVAKQTGLPYWLSDREGEDFNDYSQRLGWHRAEQSLRPFFLTKRAIDPARLAV